MSFAIGGLYNAMSGGIGYYPMSPVSGAPEDDKVGKVILNPGESDKVRPGAKSSPAECKTCAERKYQDGSDEMVSFKSASHISPEAAPAAVRSHEGEHVSNAFKKAPIITSFDTVPLLPTPVIINEINIDI